MEYRLDCADGGSKTVGWGLTGTLALWHYGMLAPVTESQMNAT